MIENQKAPIIPIYRNKHSFDRDALLTCGRGELFGKGNPQLPLPPMLMFDRITHIDDVSGAYGAGHLVAELDVLSSLWFFECHFRGDAVMPGCLGLDAMWQLIGFFLGWIGGQGHGRALGAGEVRFTGQVTPEVRMIQYVVDIVRVVKRRLFMGIANGIVVADGKTIYTARHLKVGLFQAVEDV